MKRVCFFLLAMLLFSVDVVYAQRYTTRNGVVRLTYSHPWWGQLETINRQVNVGLDAETGEMRMQVLMLSFHFNSAFNQDLYNSYFINHPQFNNTRFVGAITNIDQIDFDREGTYSVDVRGDLTMRNFTNPISTTADFIVTRGSFRGEAVFDVYIKQFMHEARPSWPDYIQISLNIDVRRL